MKHKFYCNGSEAIQKQLSPEWQTTIKLSEDKQEVRMSDKYVSPLSERYASKEMQYIFSPDMKFRTWRRAVDRPGRDREGAGTGHHTRSRSMS